MKSYLKNEDGAKEKLKNNNHAVENLIKKMYNR